MQVNGDIHLECILPDPGNPPVKEYRWCIKEGAFYVPFKITRVPNLVFNWTRVGTFKVAVYIISDKYMKTSPTVELTVEGNIINILRNCYHVILSLCYSKATD